MLTEHDFQQDIDSVASITSVPIILSTVCRTTGMRFSAIARVTAERWIVCSVKDAIGFSLAPGDALEVETTICHEVRQCGDAVVIDYVAQDAVFSSHPTPARYGFQSYISVPIRLADGSFFGTLCAIDPEPHPLSTTHAVEMFELFAQVIGSQLDSIRQAKQDHRVLLDEQATSQLREQFIAVLGHDIRTPLSALMNSIEVLNLSSSASAGQITEICATMGRSATRIKSLVDNLMDFAKGRLGGGITLDRKSVALEPVLKQVAQELQIIDPSRPLYTQIDLRKPIDCDPQRIAQLVSNLLSNAVFHGDATKPVELTASIVNNNLEIGITNSGDPIPKDKLATIFDPYVRGYVDNSLQGLGLGLNIASEISRAHDGQLLVVSDQESTKFTFLMPIVTAG